MREFVREKFASLMRCWSKFVLAENYVATHGIRMRTHDARGIGSLCISMHAHMPEIVAEARFHECAGGGIEQLPGRA